MAAEGGGAGEEQLDLSLYDYELPEERIAQEPRPERDASRLLVLDRSRTDFEHCRFSEIGRFLHAGDLLVLNDTRVIHARLRARKPTGGAVELLLLEPLVEPQGAWAALLKPGRAGRTGIRLAVEGAPGVEARILGREGQTFHLRLERGGEALAEEETVALCERCGEAPVPPYIRRGLRDPRKALDRNRYQTVYARVPGAVAAPTAGLHFTPELLERLRSAGVETVMVTLHVGLGTFKPLGEEDVRRGKLHSERVEIPEEAGRRILAARAQGRRIVAVGTTSVRALESFARSGAAPPWRSRTDLFIRPGHRFQLVDALITNFHLPRSSLLLLVAAFAGRERVLRAYEEAKARGYYFYSYGDAMLIL